VKRLVICADGTWNSRDAPRFDSRGRGLTNVAKLANAIAEHDEAGVAQEIHYDPGVGTYPWWDRLARPFGVPLARSVQECYTWLVDRYEPGDELYVFGFSRGASTARSLIGLVRNCGILRREHANRVREAYEFYCDRRAETHPAAAAAARFRADFAHPGKVCIKCVGVWDTVGALGIPLSGPAGWYTRRRRGFHDTRLTSWVENAFHALALDERRKAFAPALWEVPDAERKRPDFKQRIEQVWFPGVHANVGGGYPDCQLSDITLAWMLARASECGLALDPAAKEKLRGHCCGTMYDSMTSFYRAHGRFTRPVGATRVDAHGNPLHTFESVDQSVFDRCRKFEPMYDPENLRGYEERPRAAPTAPPA
jgi:uncharacterized protein (DUF2235 family)